MNKHKRTSDKISYCKHGKFVGYKWCGHRRHCKAPILTAAEFEKLSNNKTFVARQVAVKTGAEVVDQALIYPRSPKLLLKSLEERLGKLDSRINRITASVQRQSSIIEKAREVMMDLSKLKQEAVFERSKIMQGIEQLLEPNKAQAEVENKTKSA